MRMAVRDIIRQLPTLSTEELTMVKQAIQASGSVTNGNGSIISDTPAELSDELFYLDCLCSTLSGLGVQFTSPAALRKSDGYKLKVREVNYYLEPSKLTKMEKRKVVMIGFKLLHDNLSEIMGVPISAQLILRNFHRLPNVLELSYPGYARNGYLKQLAKAKIVHHPHMAAELTR